MGRGRERLYTPCGEPDRFAAPGLAEGVHEVQLEARLAGTNTPFRSDVARVELRCPTSATSSADAEGDSLFAQLSWQMGALVCAGQGALLFYFLLIGKRRRRRRDSVAR